MRFLDRLAAERLRRSGYTPVPSTMLAGFGAGPEDTGDVDYLAYARISNIVYACTRLRADAIAKLPLRFYSLTDKATDNRGGKRGQRVTTTGNPFAIDDPRRTRGLTLPLGARMARTGQRVVDAGEAVEVEASPMIEALSLPSDAMTWRTLVYLTEFSLCLAGRARWLAAGRDEERTKDKPPTGIQYIRHDRLAAKRWAKAGDPLITGWTLDSNTTGQREIPASAVVEFRFPDPTDPDYGALPPLAAGRLGADSYTAAMKANKAIFDNGILSPGMIGPPAGADNFWTDEQLGDVADAVARRAQGVDKAHRVLAVPYNFTYTPTTMSPKDAEFQGLLDFSIEDVGRAYGVPLEMIGGNRATYRNREMAALDFWGTAGAEAMFLAEELTERLVPMFGEGSGVDFVAFDLSGVSALQEDEDSTWAREDAQLQRGVLRTAEWRERHGLDALANEPLDASKASVVTSILTLMAQGGIAPESAAALISALGLGDKVAAAIVGDGPPAIIPVSADDEADAPAVLPEPNAGAMPDVAAKREPATRQAPAFGTPEHRALWLRVVEPSAKHEAAMRGVVVSLFEAHRDSILDRLTNADRAALAAGTRGIDLDTLPALFGRAKWLRAYREAARKALAGPFVSGGEPVAGAFDASALKASDPAAVRFLMGRAQRFAVQVNDTTWTQLRGRLAEAIAEGKGLPDLKAVVSEVMDGRIRSSAETIARTEVLSAFSAGGRLTAAAIETDTGMVLTKTWITALDERVRESHVAVHGESIPLADDFRLAGGSGPGPGEIDDAGESVNCRCVLVYDEGTGGRGMLAPTLATVEV